MNGSCCGVGIAGILLVSMLLSACATPARSNNMIAHPPLLSRVDRSSPMYEAVAIAGVGGGEETNPLVTSRVGSAELEEAVRESMRRYGYLSPPGGDARYRLDVFLLDLKQPQSAYTVIVHSSIRYRLTRIRDGKILHDDIVTAAARVGVNEELYGPARLKIANERSVQANIAAFLMRLSSIEAAP